VINALTRFYRRGAEDADRRIAAFLSTPPIGVADRYLLSSAIGRRVYRRAGMLRSAWSSSETGRAASAAHDAWARAEWPERYRVIGLVLIVAVGVHVAATIMAGDRPGWFWLIIPALTAAYAVVVLMASRSTHSPK
jgi:hypothetical protein